MGNSAPLAGDVTTVGVLPELSLRSSGFGKLTVAKAFPASVSFSKSATSVNCGGSSSGVMVWGKKQFSD